MATMPKQPEPWVTPFSLLPPEEQAREMQEAFARMFPWHASAQDLKDQGPDQRGFMIGSVRL